MPIVDIKGVGKAQFPDGMSADSIRDFLRKKYAQQSMNGESGILARQPSTAQPYEPTLSERMGQGVSDTLYNSGLVSDRYGAQQVGGTISSIGEMLPGIGDATAGDEFGRAVAEGDKVGMGIGLLGAIPIAGDALKKAVKVAKEDYAVAFKPLQVEYKLATPERKTEILREAKVLRQPLDFANSELTRAGLTGAPAKATKEEVKPNKTFKGKVYHQTSENFEDFDLSKGADGTVWFTGDKKNFTDPASSASAASGKGRVLEREVELKKVAGFDELDKYSIGELKQQGYDGAVLDGDIQVFDKSAIKQSLPVSVTENPRTGDVRIESANGKVLGSIDGDSFVIGGATIKDPSKRGKGEGKSLYIETIREAKNKGLKQVLSDESVTPDAARVWESLKKDGLPVVKNKDAYFINDKDGGFWAVKDDLPVYSLDITQ